MQHIICLNVTPGYNILKDMAEFLTLTLVIYIYHKNPTSNKKDMKHIELQNICPTKGRNEKQHIIWKQYLT